MNDESNKLNQLQERLAQLESRYNQFGTEIDEIKSQIKAFLPKGNTENNEVEESQSYDTKKAKEASGFKARSNVLSQKGSASLTPHIVPKSHRSFPIRKGKFFDVDIEKFIGENLANKIGILLTIVGIFIIGKYSIENNLINPVSRIIIGYFSGIVLLATAMKLKGNYEKFSAVILGGALCIFYFITYFAFDFYNIIPQSVAFVLMVLITAFAVVAALMYDREIIATIGLVGAYAIPFLLSNDTGNVTFLFSYLALINIGILIIAFKKSWRIAGLTSFVFTWLIFLGWYQSIDHEILFFQSIVFSFIFYIIFYITLIANKFRVNQKFEIVDISLILTNSFIFYAIGFHGLTEMNYAKEIIGLFTIFNGFIHLVFAYFLYKRKLATNAIFYLISGLVLVFITIAIPIQLDGSWVTLLWIFEALLLFWIGRTKNQAVFESLSYIVTLVAAISLLEDWSLSYYAIMNVESPEYFSALINQHFLVSIIFIGVTIAIYKLLNNPKYVTSLPSFNILNDIYIVLLPLLLLAVTFFTFFNEIKYYWDLKYLLSEINSVQGSDGYSITDRNYNFVLLGRVWLYIYTMLFAALLAFFNLHKWKIRILGVGGLIANTLISFGFVTVILIVLSILQHDYLNVNSNQIFNAPIMNIWIRYVAILAFVPLLYLQYKYPRVEFMKLNSFKKYDLTLAFFILCLLSAELFNVLNFMEYQGEDKILLSILWALCALMLVSLGIWKNMKHLRIAAIILFAVILLKVFFYDTTHLTTISKTILLVSLGILLLLISFLYNKFKHLIKNV